MFKKLLLTFFFIYWFFHNYLSFKKENTDLFDYCYSLEKIFIRNSVEKNKNLSENLRQ